MSCRFNQIKTANTLGNVLVSTTIFRPAQKRNQRFQVYLDGIQNMCRVYQSVRPNWTVRLYTDQSLQSHRYPEDTRLYQQFYKRVLQHLNNLEIYHYECPSHMEDSEHHRGMFGSVMRFHAGTESRVVIFRDIDFVPDSVRNDIYNVERWIETSDDYMFYYNPHYFPEHAENRESLYAGAWGVKNGALTVIWEDILRVSEHPEWAFYKIYREHLNQLNHLTGNQVARLERTLNEDLSQDLSEEQCVDLYESYSGVEFSKLLKLFGKHLTISDLRAKKPLLIKLAQIVYCLDNYQLGREALIDFLDLHQELTKAIFSYGIDEIILNHIVKPHVFRMSSKTHNPTRIPISLLDSCMKRELKFEDYYHCILVETAKDKMYYDELGSDQEDFLRDAYQVYFRKYRQKPPSVYLVQLIYPDQWLRSIRCFMLRYGHQTTRRRFSDWLDAVLENYIDLSVISVRVANEILPPKDFQEVAKVLIEMDDVTARSYITDSRLLLSDYVEQAVEILYRMLRFYGIGTFQDYQNHQVLNILL